MIETTSLELSKKLEPILEGRVEGFFIYSREVSADRQTKSEFEISTRRHATCGWWEVIPAYTACELMKVLPSYSSVKHPHGGHAFFPDCANCEILAFEDKNPAEALGEMVVWLSEKGLLK
jgi:hypothetical protein